MKLTDGRTMVEITMKMKIWNGENGSWGCDISSEFFADVREFDGGVAVVEDVDYCVEMARDWEGGVGDYYDLPDDEERVAIVDDITTDSAETIACTLRHTDEWESELVEALVKAAGMEDEYRKACADVPGIAEGDRTFESVIFAAAGALGVEIL